VSLRCPSTLFGLDRGLHSLASASFASASSQSGQSIARRLDSGCLRADHLGVTDHLGLSRLRFCSHSHRPVLSLLGLVQFLSSIVESPSYELDIDRTAYSHIPFRARANIERKDSLSLSSLDRLRRLRSVVLLHLRGSVPVC
jgi:hypothetical protein